ncbi:MAG: polyprenyl diphosphate synthase [Firmicutes bacterium]|nr:polyprenyl diphosphate synthase [Bacillota bacterium]
MAKHAQLNPDKLPNHIAVIMDGNGRWATKRLLPRPAGHRKGVATLEKLVEYVHEIGIKYLTVYAFSTENTARPKDEINGLIKLIHTYFKKSLPKFIAQESRVRIIGDRTYFSQELQDILSSAERKTEHFTKLTLSIALNYGARDEIIRAVNAAVQAGQPVTEQGFSTLLDTAQIPDPDMLIRTGGEQRLSNFLLYQTAYAELFFIPDLWPDFNKKRLHELLAEYAVRTRRFGK